MACWRQFRGKGLLGLGVIEARCKTAIGSRLKRSGMFRTVRGTTGSTAQIDCRLRVAHASPIRPYGPATVSPAFAPPSP
jgi:hypothetical protein